MNEPQTKTEKVGEAVAQFNAFASELIRHKVFCKKCEEKLRDLMCASQRVMINTVLKDKELFERVKKGCKTKKH